MVTQPRTPAGSPDGGQFGTVPAGLEGELFPRRRPAPAHPALDAQIAKFVAASPPPAGGDERRAWEDDFVNGAAIFGSIDYTDEYDVWAAAEAPHTEIDEDEYDEEATRFALESTYIQERLNAFVDNNLGGTND